MSTRFHEINEKDVDEFNETEENQNTKRKTELDVNFIHSYIASEAASHVNRPPRMEELRTLSEKTSILRVCSHGTKLCPNKRNTEVETKATKARWKRKQTIQAASLTKEEIEMLYSSGAFGCNSPQALINTLWYNNCLHFGLRGGKEQRDLKWGDGLLKKDTEAGPERNPVFLYKLYKAKRPESYMDNNAPFYPGVNHANASKADLPGLKWFKPQPMGVNKLNSLIKDCAQLAGIGKDKRITTHSARNTLVQKLQDNNVPPTQLVQITGHKNLQSVNNYSSLRQQQQQDISSILSSVPNVGNARSSLSAQETISFSVKQDAINPSSSLFQGNSITGGRLISTYLALRLLRRTQ
ncbi:zinc finger MYM-type 2-like [Paramuricea clavata]|uniref:Zinc finger MYM-type 2-like n=1 Tax=Paramuricea clavata TaxID=317549 RepID=A0A7D9L802_PARCT|nr:zinc finger MYM-type 2-like [Paramuricea clavata]